MLEGVFVYYQPHQSYLVLLRYQSQYILPIHKRLVSTVNPRVDLTYLSCNLCSSLRYGSNSLSQIAKPSPWFSWSPFTIYDIFRFHSLPALMSYITGLSYFFSPNIRCFTKYSLTHQMYCFFVFESRPKCPPD